MNRLELTNKLHSALLPVLVVSWMILAGSFAFLDQNLYEYGEFAGKTAIVLLWIVSIPGILKRFQAKGVFQNVQIILMRSRRRLGDLMFTFGLMHYLWMRGFLYLRTSFPTPGEMPLFELLGFTGLMLLVPLFITSNNYSVRLLKKNWQRIHYLIYVSMWLIAFHVALQGNALYALPTFSIAILQAGSWMYFLSNKNKTQTTQQETKK